MSFETCISSGYAPDGGLYVPESMPELSLQTLAEWRRMDYVSLAEQLFGLFAGEEVDSAVLRGILEASYADFAVDEKVPVRRVGELFVAELSHGPTLCFKDLGQQPLIRLLAHFAERGGYRRTMLVATTGDTGPAAMRAVADSKSRSLDLTVFFPEGQISDLQRRQMTTNVTANARVVCFQGGGDDMDLPIKRMATDRQFAKEFGLCGLNSYNLGRVVSQMVHYVWTYFRTIDACGLDLGKEIDVVVPTGAMGNVTAGLMTRCMGLPIRRFVAAVNTNDITHRTIQAGEFHRSTEMQQTLSDAINIQVPYNMERVFYFVTGQDVALVSEWMGEMDKSGKLTLPVQWQDKLREIFGSQRVDDAAMCSAMQQCLGDFKYLADPHTAVGLSAAWRTYGCGRTEVPVVVMSTASPCKFEASVTHAIGKDRWKEYEASAEFPESARAVLSAEEQPYQKFTASGRPLAESQAAWEAEVRRQVSQRSRL